MKRAELRKQLPIIMDQMQSVPHNSKVYQYYLKRFTEVCDQLHDMFRQEYPLNKDIRK